MANRKVDIRVGIRSEEFTAGVDRMKTSVKGVGTAFADSIKKGSAAGLESLRGSVKGLTGDLGHAIKLGASLGGGLSFGAAAKGALELRSQFQALAFSSQIATGQTKNWRDMLERARVAAEKTGRTAGELGAAFDSVLQEVGDFDLAEKSMKTIGAAASATQKPIELMSGVVGALGDKFGITGGEIDDAMATVIELANKGGAQLEDLPGILQVTGASARAAGMMGSEGFRQMIAMFNMAGDALGSTKKGVKAVSTLLDQMVDPNVAKQIKQVFHVDTKDAEGNARKFTDVMGDIFKATGGKREKLAVVFKGEQMKLVTELAKKFEAGFDAMQGTAKEKSKAGAESYKRALEEAGRTTLTFADVEKQAAEQRKNPEVLIKQGLDRLAIAFTKPEMLDAMDKLAEAIPKVVDVLSGAADALAKHPLLSTAAVVAGPSLAKAALSAGGSAAGGLLLGGAKGALTSIRGARAATAAAQGLSALGGGATTIATTGTTVAGAGVAATAGAAAAALAGVGAAIYQGFKLVGDIKKSGTSGGFLEGLFSLAKGPAKAASPEEFDRIMGAKGLLPAAPAAAKPEEKKAESAAQLEKATAKGAKNTERSAIAQERAAKASERLAAAIERAAGVVGGPERGPFRLPPAGAGAAPTPQGQ